MKDLYNHTDSTASTVTLTESGSAKQGHCAIWLHTLHCAFYCTHHTGFGPPLLQTVSHLPRSCPSLPGSLLPHSALWSLRRAVAVGAALLVGALCILPTGSLGAIRSSHTMLCIRYGVHALNPEPQHPTEQHPMLLTCTAVAPARQTVCFRTVFCGNSAVVAVGATLLIRALEISIWPACSTGCRKRRIGLGQ